MTAPSERTVTISPAAVNTVAVGRGIVDVPITRPLGPRDIAVPLTVMAGALGVNVVPAIATPFERTVADWPAAVIIREAAVDGAWRANAMLLVPMCSTEESRIPQYLRW